MCPAGVTSISKPFTWVTRSWSRPSTEPDTLTGSASVSARSEIELT